MNGGTHKNHSDCVSITVRFVSIMRKYSGDKREIQVEVPTDSAQAIPSGRISRLTRRRAPERPNRPVSLLKIGIFVMESVKKGSEGHAPASSYYYAA